MVAFHVASVDVSGCLRCLFAVRVYAGIYHWENSGLVGDPWVKEKEQVPGVIKLPDQTLKRGSKRKKEGLVPEKDRSIGRQQGDLLM